MNLDDDLPCNRHDDLNRLHDEAHERALQLRGDAIDAFWHSMAGGACAHWLSAQRAARRFAYRLQRHARLRDAARLNLRRGAG